MIPDNLNFVTMNFPTCEFDGHEFYTTIGGNAWALKMAYDARRGDEVSRKILEAFKIKIITADESTYWPMEDAPTIVEGS